MASLHSNFANEFAAATSQGVITDLVQTPSDGAQHKYDSYNLIKIAMFIIGIGAVLSPNALLLCASYYREEYNNSIIYYIMPIYSISYIIFLLILTKCSAISNVSFTSRVIISFLLCALTLFGLVRFANNHAWHSFFFGLIVFIIGMTSSILNRSLLGFTNILESSYKHIHISGEELSGVIASIIRVITRLCYGNDPVGSANTYFICIISYCALCAALFASIRFTDYVAFRLNIYVLYIARHKSASCKQSSLYSPYTRTQKKSKKKAQQSSHSNLDQIHEIHSESTLYKQSSDQSTSEIESSEEQYKKISVDEYQTYKHSLSVANASAKSLPLQNENTVDITNFVDSFKYKPNIAAAAVIPAVGEAHKSLMTSTHNRNSYKSTNSKKRYSSLLFDDTNSKSFGFYKLSKKLRLYCLIMLLSNLLSWSIVPGMIGGKVKSDLIFIRENDWQSILLMSEYFISNYFGRLVMSSPSFWWFCCEYNDYNTIKHVVIRNLGCCPICCGKSNVIIAHRFLLWLSILRIMLIYPVFLIIYFNIYDINWIAHFLMMLTGITQGYIYHMSFELAPKHEPKYRRETTTLMLQFFHFGGIAIGSITALAVSQIDELTLHRN